MDAFGLFSSGLFSGYSIIWAGGNVESAANGAFLIVTSIYYVGSPYSCTFNGIAVIKNGASATVGGIGGHSEYTITVSDISIEYSGSAVTIDTGNSNGGWCGFIIA